MYACVFEKNKRPKLIRSGWIKIIGRSPQAAICESTHDNATTSQASRASSQVDDAANGAYEDVQDVGNDRSQSLGGGDGDDNKVERQRESQAASE